MLGLGRQRPLVGMLVVAGLLALPATAGAAVPAGNLVQNPGAEASEGTGPPGWGANAEFTSVKYGTSGFPTTALSASIGGESNFFAGGPNVASTVAEQTFDVAAAGGEIDTGNVSVRLRAYLGGSLTDGDNAKITAEFQDAHADTTFSTLQLGPVTSADRGNATTLLARSASATVPAQTRRIRLTLTATRTAGGSLYNNGYADNVSLSLDDPVAVDDSATIGQNADATSIDVLANDTDLYGGPKQVASVTQPANGTATVAAGGTGLSYKPNQTYCNSRAGGAPETFTYTLNGGSTATVTVSVPCIDIPPVAVDDSVTIDRNAGATRIDVLANDTDPDGGPKLVAAATQGARGNVAVVPDGFGVTYTPTACNAQVGAVPDTFTYTLNGGSRATVTVNVPCFFGLPVPGTCGNVLEGTSPNQAIILNGIGTAGDDRMVGGPQSDRMRGLAGDDCLSGRHGNDRLDGGAGRDDLHGDEGSDRLAGAAGADRLSGGTGNDGLSGGSGADSMSGGAGGDDLSGGSGDDRLTGSAGNDRISPGTGEDRVSSGSGRDTISARDGTRDSIDCGSGRDRVTADRLDRISRDCERVTRRR